MSDQAEYRSIDLTGYPSVHHSPQKKPEMLWVPVDHLVFDQRFQRSIEKRGKSNIQSIAAEFEWGRFTPLLVAPTDDGKLSVIDGQHRAHAAALCGYRSVPAMVVPMSLSDQAKAFAWINGSVTHVSGFHIFKAALTAGEKWAVRSDLAVSRAGCRLMQSNKSADEKKPGEVFCIATIKSLITLDRDETVTLALRSIHASKQGGDVHMYSADVLGPWFAMVDRTDRVTSDELIAFLNANSFASILRRVARLRETPAYFRKSTRALFEESLVALFNQFRRGQNS